MGPGVVFVRGEPYQNVFARLADAYLQWSPFLRTMPQCSNMTVEFDTDTATPWKANPSPAPPYTVFVYRGGSQPLSMAVGNLGECSNLFSWGCCSVVLPGTNGTYSWIVNLAVGPSYMLSMKDSAGYSGGVYVIRNIYQSSHTN